MREKTFNMRLTPEEWERFERVARHHEMTVAGVIRMLMKREDASAVGPFVLIKDGRPVGVDLPAAPEGVRVLSPDEEWPKRGVAVLPVGIKATYPEERRAARGKKAPKE
jgi:hypothetical protein